MRILIAPDKLVSRRLLEKTMQRAGYEVTAVENGSAWREPKRFAKPSRSARANISGLSAYVHEFWTIAPPGMGLSVGSGIASRGGFGSLRRKG